MLKDKVLITGACGQVGSELTESLRNLYSAEQVIATDIREPNSFISGSGPFQKLDVMDEKNLIELIRQHKITHIYHLAALLSASSEQKPMFAWKLNMDSLLNILNVARDNDVKKAFYPSSIAVFGPNTPKMNTPQMCVMDPNTVYGISKLAGERWCEYYFQKYGLDVRGLRYPGLISYKTDPGGGTTDYAIEIFYEAIKHKKFNCFLSENTRLPMLYMSDAIKATINLMEAPSENINIRSAYNLTGFSFTPDELAKELKKHIPDFEITYKPDFRQKIADSWPQLIDDSSARKEWNWKHDYDMEAMTTDMLKNITIKLKKETAQ